MTDWLPSSTVIITALIGGGWAIFWFWVRSISADVKNTISKTEYEADLKETKDKHDGLATLVHENFRDLKDEVNNFRNELPKMYPSRFEFSQEIKKLDRGIIELKNTIKDEGRKTVEIITQRLEDLGVTKKH